MRSTLMKAMVAAGIVLATTSAARAHPSTSPSIHPMPITGPSSSVLGVPATFSRQPVFPTVRTRPFVPSLSTTRVPLDVLQRVRVASPLSVRTRAVSMPRAARHISRMREARRDDRTADRHMARVHEERRDDRTVDRHADRREERRDDRTADRHMNRVREERRDDRTAEQRIDVLKKRSAQLEHSIDVVQHQRALPMRVRQQRIAKIREQQADLRNQMQKLHLLM